jgi:RNA recognition motif-containing protein
VPRSASDAGTATQRIHVGNLPAWVREEDLEQLFGPFGPVEAVVVPSDRETETGQGFGFVDMAASDAERAILALHKSAYGDHVIQVALVRAASDMSPAGHAQHAYGSGDGRG